MLVTKNYIFHYDARMSSSRHTKYTEHDGQACTAYFFRSEENINEEPTTFDVVHVVFADGFHANVFAYELEAVN